MQCYIFSTIRLRTWPFSMDPYPVPRLPRLEIHSYTIFEVKNSLFEQLLNANRSTIPIGKVEKSRCPLDSVLATSSQFQSLLTASGLESETLLINLMPFVLSESAITNMNNRLLDQD